MNIFDRVIFDFMRFHFSLLRKICLQQKKQVDVDMFARDQIHRVDQTDGSSAWVAQNPVVAGGIPVPQ